MMILCLNGFWNGQEYYTVALLLLTSERLEITPGVKMIFFETLVYGTVMELIIELVKYNKVSL